MSVGAGINSEYIAYASVAGLIGSGMFYLSLNAKTTFSQRVKTMIVSIVIGAVAYIVSYHYYPSKDDVINWAIYPLAAGFSAPWTLKGFAATLYAFSQNPIKTINEIADAIKKIKQSKKDD